jgi:hypothetical protein
VWLIPQAWFGNHQPVVARKPASGKSQTIMVIDWFPMRFRMQPTSEPIPAPTPKTPKTDTTAVALLGAMPIVLATLGGASLSAGGSGALQEVAPAPRSSTNGAVSDFASVHGYQFVKHQ